MIDTIGSIIEQYVEARVRLSEAAAGVEYGDNAPEDGPIGYPEAVRAMRGVSSTLRRAIADWEPGMRRTYRLSRGISDIEMTLTKNEGPGFGAVTQERPRAEADVVEAAAIESR